MTIEYLLCRAGLYFDFRSNAIIGKLQLILLGKLIDNVHQLYKFSSNQSILNIRYSYKFVSQRPFYWNYSKNFTYKVHCKGSIFKKYMQTYQSIKSLKVIKFPDKHSNN